MCDLYNTLKNPNRKIQSLPTLTSITVPLVVETNSVFHRNFTCFKDICQLDGNNDLSSEEICQPCKKIFAVNCEIQEIIDIINFFRSLNILWISTKEHKLCGLDQNCFFCNIRSSCLRVRQERGTGPEILKVNEYTCQLQQYGSNWRASISDMPTFIKE